MRVRTKVVLTAALAVLVVGVGVAAASYPGGGSYGDYPGNEESTEKEGADGGTKPSYTRTSWSAYMNGEAEVDDEGNPGVGDRRATGVASFMQADRSTLCYGFSVNGTDTPTAIHIHKGKVGRNGPPVIGFANLPKGSDGEPGGNPGTSSGCKPLEPSEVDALKAIRKHTRKQARKKRAAGKPLNYYVNVHTEAFPAGAVRGQIAPIPFRDR